MELINASEANRRAIANRTINKYKDVIIEKIQKAIDEGWLYTSISEFAEFSCINDENKAILVEWLKENGYKVSLSVNFGNHGESYGDIITISWEN